MDAETWHRANAQLTQNRRLSKKNAKHQYLLRGLVQCRSCGAAYVGTRHRTSKEDGMFYFYRCSH